jgi:hypothetical protein
MLRFEGSVASNSALLSISSLYLAKIPSGDKLRLVWSVKAQLWDAGEFVRQNRSRFSFGGSAQATIGGISRRDANGRAQLRW